MLSSVVDESFSPSAMLQIQYKKSGQDIAPGNKLKPEETEEIPDIMFVPSDENAYYTLMLVMFYIFDTHTRRWNPHVTLCLH